MNKERIRGVHILAAFFCTLLMFSFFVLAYKDVGAGILWFLKNSLWWLFLSMPLSALIETWSKTKQKSDLHKYVFVGNLLGSLIVYLLRYQVFGNSEHIFFDAIGVAAFTLVNQLMLSFFIVQFHVDTEKKTNADPDLLDS